MTEGKRIAGNIIFLEPQFLTSKIIPFFYGANTIGRRPENTIRIEELSVSSKHAVLKVTEKSLTITDTNSRNGVKINSEENRIAPNTEIAIDGGMIVYFGDVKCKFQRGEAVDSAELTMPSRVDVKRNVKYEEIKNLLALQDEEQDKDLLRTRKESLEMKAKQEMNDSFSISEHFVEKEKKGGKANNKKQSKKNTKVIVEEKEEHKEEKNVEKSVQEKKKETKRDSLDRKNAKKNEEGNAPAAKSTKPEQKEKPKGGKEQKQVIFQQADKKSLEKEEVRSNISKEKSDKTKPPKQKQKPKEVKQPERPMQRRSQRQQKKAKSLSKQALKEQQKQREQGNKRDRKKSVHLTIEETKSEEESERRPSPSRSRKSARLNQGQKTKRRTENRKRLPSEIVPLDQSLPARRSFMNKRIMASGFILNLNKKYFCPVETPQDGFDYLIMKEYKRTYKALFAISHGIPIIRYDWIRESQYFEKTMKPENYYFKDLEGIYKAIGKAKDGERIFRGLEFFLGSDQYHLKAEEIEMLIYSCGGEICRKVGKLSPKEKESKNLIAIVRNKEAASAKVYEEELKAMKKMGFEKAYTIELILDSCEKQAVDWSSNEVRLR